MKKMENVADIYPLTPTQLGMLYHTLRDPESNHYFEQVRCDLSGPLKIGCFREAWEAVVRHHPPLRTLFLWEGVEQPLQVVRDRVELPMEFLDWRERDPERAAADLESLSDELRQAGFDLTRAPILNITAVQLSDDLTHLIWNFHHMVLDGWSSAIVLDEVLKNYSALAVGGQPSISIVRPFRDYLGWLKKQDHVAAKEYWQSQVGDIASPTPLQVDHKVPQGRFDLGRYSVTLPAAVTQKLKRIAQANRLTMNTIVQGAWAMLLSRYSGQDDVVFGVTSSGRPADLPQVEEMVGMFLNTLPLRLDLGEDLPFATWLQQVQNQQLEINQYQYSSLADIQRWSGVPAGQPLFESVVIFENYPEASVDPSLPLQITNKQVREQTNFALTLLIGVDEQLELLFLTNRLRLPDEIVKRMADHLIHLFNQIASDPTLTLHQISILGPDERRKILVEWNQTDAPFPADTTVAALFAEQVSKTPDQTALIYNQEEMSYRMLDRRSNQLARALRDQGVGPGIPVGIAMHRSFDTVVGMVAVVKAGGAYVPMDPNYPPERLKIIVEDVAMPVILTDRAIEPDLPTGGTPTILLDRFEYEGYSADPLPIFAEPTSPLFITFTSGSTGRPKGVQGHHRAFINRCQWQWDRYPLGENEIFCHKTTLSFVDHLWEIWGPLLKGKKAVIIPDEVVKDADRFLALLADYKIERIVLVPSFVRVLLDSYPDLAERVPHLKYWTLSGESVSRSLADLFRARMPHALLLNFYGMSEGMADATWYDDRWEVECETIPIGKPINNMKAYVLDKRLQPVPIGVPGEIYLSGVGLSEGYWGRDDLTAERFFSNPFDDKADSRLYQSGDVGRWLPEGQLEYIGRADHQVKIRGFRIEPGEIEAAIRTHPAVSDAVVVPHDFGHDKRLIAYVIADRVLEQEEIRQQTRQRLPEYMVPAGVVFLETFPKTPNGKINRLGLAKPNIVRPVADAKSFTPVQARMIALWKELLGIGEIGLDDDFFEIGGHSLLALRLFSRFKKEFDLNLPLATLVAAPTPRLLSALLDPGQPAEAVPLPNWHHLVPFEESGQEVGTIFCVHGAGGNVLNFHQLAQKLQPAWRLIGVQASGVDGESPILETMDQVCDSYLAEITAFQPAGPYFLAGFSSGGVIAYEMAQRLKAAGETVAEVILLDTFHPATRPRRRRIIDHFSGLMDYGPTYFFDLWRDRQTRKDDEEGAVDIALAAKKAGKVVPHELRNSLMVHYMTKVMHEYRPEQYDGPVILCAAREVYWMLNHIPVHRGWADLVMDLTIIESGGNHDTLVLEPHVADLAHNLTRVLARSRELQFQE